MSRPAKPLALHRLQGSFRNDRHGGKEIPGEKLSAVPGAPRHLSAKARAVWKPLARELVAVGLLTARDLHVLADYCAVRATILECEAVIAAEGRTVTTPQGKKRHPELVTLEKARTEIRSLGALLGLSPSDRAKLRLPERSQRDDDEIAKFERFFGAGSERKRGA